MSDVLAVLNSLLHRVASILMPTELDDVLSFLVGNQWHRVEDHATDTSTTSSPSTATATRASGCRYVPDGRVAHHGFIPLAIAADALASLASGGDRTTLQHLFARQGFERVIAVSLCPTSLSAGAASSDGTEETMGESATAPDDAAAVRVEAPLGRRRTRAQRDGQAWDTIDAENTTAGRLACANAVRRWFAALEAEASRDEPSEAVERKDETAAMMPRSLLLVVRCTADNRELAVPTSSSPSSSSSTAVMMARGAARRFSERADPLFLLLHDLAAVHALYEVRLARCGGAPAHVGVLLLPDDHLYGGMLLQQRLRREVSYRYVVRLFQGGDGEPTVMRTSSAATKTTTTTTTTKTTTMKTTTKKATKAKTGPLEDEERHVSVLLSARWARAGRLLTLWEPGWATRLTTAGAPNDLAATPTTSSSSATMCVTDTMLEQHLAGRRGDGAFFLRPSNLPLCAFLHEALRRFPLLLRPAHLALLQAAWTSRHALVDLLWAFHALVMPFTTTTTSTNAAGAHGHAAEDARAFSPTTTGAAPSAHEVGPTGRQRTRFAEVYADATHLVDALCEVAVTMSAATSEVALSATMAGPHTARRRGATVALDEAVAFMLLFDEVSRPHASMHVLRAEPIVVALAALYDREVHAWAATTAARSDRVRRRTASLLARTATEKARQALLGGHLPFHRPSPLCHTTTVAEQGVPSWPVRLPAVMRVAGVQLSVAGALHASAVSAILDPEASLKELVEVAGGVRETTSPHNFYSPLTPDTLRVMHVLATHAMCTSVEREKHVPLVQLQQLCQLTDAGLLQTLHELTVLGFIMVNSAAQTARSLLGN